MDLRLNYYPDKENINANLAHLQQPHNVHDKSFPVTAYPQHFQ
jgi:hypothetical protein